MEYCIQSKCLIQTQSDSSKRPPAKLAAIEQKIADKGKQKLFSYLKKMPFKGGGIAQRLAHWLSVPAAPGSIIGVPYNFQLDLIDVAVI